MKRLVRLLSEKKMLTRDEKALLDRLAPSPKCMHDPQHVTEREYHWQCNQCGLIAKKTIPVFLEDKR